MSGFVDTLERAVLDHVLGGVTYTPPANWFIGLSTTTPDDTGANFTEPVGNGYARVSTGPADWNAATGAAPAVKDNANPIDFPTPTGLWGTVTNFGFFAAATGGTPQLLGVLTTAKPIDTGDPASFAPGALRAMLGDPTDPYT